MSTLRVVRVIALLIVVTAGCAGRARAPEIRVLAELPDSTIVRFSTALSRPAAVGRALGWSQGKRLLVTAVGDTLQVPAEAELERLIDPDVGHAGIGAAVGFAVAVSIVYARCPPPRRLCGEQNPIPLIGAALGALIGLGVRTERWERFRLGDRLGGKEQP